eukprot:3310384-Rhodomonas_salina.2
MRQVEAASLRHARVTVRPVYQKLVHPKHPYLRVRSGPKQCHGWSKASAGDSTRFLTLLSARRRPSHRSLQGFVSESSSMTRSRRQLECNSQARHGHGPARDAAFRGQRRPPSDGNWRVNTRPRQTNARSCPATIGAHARAAEKPARASARIGVVSAAELTSGEHARERGGGGRVHGFDEDEREREQCRALPHYLPVLRLHACPRTRTRHPIPAQALNYTICDGSRVAPFEASTGFEADAQQKKQKKRLVDGGEELERTWQEGGGREDCEGCSQFQQLETPARARDRAQTTP